LEGPLAGAAGSLWVSKRTVWKNSRFEEQPFRKTAISKNQPFLKNSRFDTNSRS
jgi:hypothetical protein